MGQKLDPAEEVVLRVIQAADKHKCQKVLLNVSGKKRVEAMHKAVEEHFGECVEVTKTSATFQRADGAELTIQMVARRRP